MRFVVIVPLWVGLMACGGVIHPVNQEPPAPVTVPSAWTVQTSTGSSDPGRWWSEFQEPELEDLVEGALARNLDLVAAYARVQQARAVRATARSGRFPQINADTSVVRSQRNINFGMGTQSFSQTQFDVGANLSYEVDVWGRVAHAAKAAGADFHATDADVQAATLSLASQVAQTYFELVEQQAILQLLHAQVEASMTFLELLELRFDQGAATGLDVFQQREQVQSNLTLLPPVQARIEVLENVLSVLLARPPQSVEATTFDLPEPPEVPSVGVPSQVLMQRPDVRAAQLRLVAQDHRLGSAIADRFPRINLSGNVGFTSFDDLAQLFDGFAWSLVAGLTAPVFEGGRRIAEVKRNRAALEEQVALYASTLLTALQEVENALVQEARQVELVAALERQLAAARSTLEEARLRYANGLSDYLPVLTALTSTQRLERLVLAARRERLRFRVELYTALGGAWPVTQAPAQLPTASEASPVLETGEAT